MNQVTLSGRLTCDPELTYNNATMDDDNIPF